MLQAIILIRAQQANGWNVGEFWEVAVLGFQIKPAAGADRGGVWHVVLQMNMELMFALFANLSQVKFA